MLRVLLIGGFAKGHDRPFHPATLSGKRLRMMVDEVGLNALYLDLWDTSAEENAGKIDRVTIAIINHHLKHGVKCVALGRWVAKCLIRSGIHIPYLPHPASRRKSDIQRLKAGLIRLELLNDCIFRNIVRKISDTTC